MSGYTVTVRRGPKVSRQKHETLAGALEKVRRVAEDVRDESSLPSVTMLREFKPSDRVAARVEISTGGWLRGVSGGVDVMGDGSIVAFRGGLHRRPLEPRRGETPYDAVRRALDG